MFRNNTLGHLPSLSSTFLGQAFGDQLEGANSLRTPSQAPCQPGGLHVPGEVHEVTAPLKPSELGTGIPKYLYVISWGTLTYLTETDTAVEKRMRKIRAWTQRHLDLYARDGLRTLCIAKKVSLVCARPNGSSPDAAFSVFRRPLMLAALI